jgi:hypothetical protein
VFKLPCLHRCAPNVYQNVQDFPKVLCSISKVCTMCIGIIYDTYTRDYWYRIEKDISTVRVALRSIRLPLPVACIYDASRNQFIELNEEYVRHRAELLERARSIFLKYIQDKLTRSDHNDIPTQALPQHERKDRPKINRQGNRSK